MLGIGIDFGTSNSAVALARPGEPARLARHERVLEGGSADTAPTVLFYPGYERATHFGHAAVARYLGAGLEGRFVQSMKAYLPSRTFTGTVIRGRTLTIEDLVATFLGSLLDAASADLGVDVRGPDVEVVLGRPARFSDDDALDQLAEERLVRAARAAGLARFRFLIEPVAAALAYEATLAADEVVLVVDLGGGTSDFTVMEVGPGPRARRERRSSILASRGVPAAGDRFDGEIVRAALLPALGLGSDYLAFTDRTPVPHWIFERLLEWNRVSFLKARDMLEFLRSAARTSSDPAALARLLRIVEEDQGYLMFRAVERAKRALAEATEARIEDELHALAVEGVITRTAFEEGTRALVERIHGGAVGALADAGLGPDRVDAVFMTGGSSLLAPVRRRFVETFGAARLRGGETFTSVAAGLARAADLEL